MKQFDGKNKRPTRTSSREIRIFSIPSFDVFFPESFLFNQKKYPKKKHFQNQKQQKITDMIRLCNIIIIINPEDLNYILNLVTERTKTFQINIERERERDCQCVASTN